MPIPARAPPGHTELSKKHDDLWPASSEIVSIPTWLWINWRSGPRIRKRRVATTFIAVGLLYLLLRSIPIDQASFPHQSGGWSLEKPRAGYQGSHPAAPDASPAPDFLGYSEAGKYYYNERLQFFHLAASLYKAASTMGFKDENRNIMFAAASLQSASRLLPMACEMARWNRNVVHFAVMGREALSIQEIQQVNGIDSQCKIYWHDARPDISEYSSNARMESSVTSAMGHFHDFIHPQLYIIDEAGLEEAFLTRAVRQVAFELERQVIELPADAVQRLMWITRLDTGALKAWHTSEIDILIHAPLGSSGSLIRLLQSIKRADYFGARRPHITIEIPPEMDAVTMSFLHQFVWPPATATGGSHVSQLTLRHRVSPHRLTEDEAPARFVESFYPSRPHHSHVLVLSPQVELSPLYYHFLLYCLLEYKHSSYKQNEASRKLLGLSLELPAHTLLDEPFSLLSGGDDVQHSPFLWQSPSSNAALYFGDKWMEFHSFLSHRLEFNKTHPVTRPNLASTSHPAWTGYLLELMLARGYELLYPSPSIQGAIATVHRELFELPEEYVPSATSMTSAPAASIDPHQILVHEGQQLFPQRSELSLLAVPLTQVLPNDADLPLLDSLSVISSTGKLLVAASIEAKTRHFSEEFRSTIGGCEENSEKTRHAFLADDLFCWSDQESKDVEARPASDDRQSESAPASTTTGKTKAQLMEKKQMSSESLVHLERQEQG